jgi:t-SNARE complex subunit (syntaxin)
MKDELLGDKTKLFMDYRKVSEKIKKHYNKIKADTYDEKDWKKDSKSVTKDIKDFEKKLELMKNYVDNNDDDQNVQKFQDEINKSSSIEEMVDEIKEKTKDYNIPTEMADLEGGGDNNNDDDDENQAQEQKDIVIDLMANKEILDQRRKDLENIHKTSGMIKDMTQQMNNNLAEQKDILNHIEVNTEKVENNAEKAKEEIKKAEEYQKGNSKRLLCLIVIAAVAVLAVVGIVLGATLGGGDDETPEQKN